MGRIIHNNYVTIAKAIGIILMVVGHSGCPQVLFRFIYLFHMPFFFFCSGIFYKEISTKANVETYMKKRVRGLYIPFVKWSVLFLLLHNVFLLTGIYNSYYGFDGGSVFYSISDVFQRLFMILFTMNGYEEILGGFWFIRSLFVSCLLIAVVSYIFRYDFRYKYWLLCVSFLVATIAIRRIVPNIEFWREISMGCLGAMSYLLGYLLMPFSRYWQNRYSFLICCFSFRFVSYFFTVVYGINVAHVAEHPVIKDISSLPLLLVDYILLRRNSDSSIVEQSLAHYN